MSDRYLIVNADDFGHSAGVNRGIIAAHERGIVTSASLMVRGLAATDAVVYAQACPTLSIGLHVDLGEWAYRDGEWGAVYEVVDVSDAAAVTAEVERQVTEFRRLMLRPPTHLDSHQHVHRDEPVASVLAAAAANLGVPLRERTPSVCYRGDFYGQTGRGEPYHEAITLAALDRLMESLADGWTEMGCHPGEPDADLVSTYARERALELAVLSDPAARDAVGRHRVHLASFADLLRA